jgi:hypothetical protein
MVTRVDSQYQGIYLGSNTEGKSYNYSFTLAKTSNQILLMLTSLELILTENLLLMDATSSQNQSQWNNIETVNGSNSLRLARSDFDPGRRIISNGNATIKWSKFTKSRIGFFYEGSRYSNKLYIQWSFITRYFSNSALIFIPAQQTDIVLVQAIATPAYQTQTTPQQQWEALSSFIEGNEYLRERKGSYAERNGDRLKTSHVVDLKFAQEFTKCW